MHSVDHSLLSSIDLFRELQPDELNQVCDILQPMRADEAEMLFRRGAPANMLYITISGNYMVYFEDGRAFTLHKTGEIMGWSSIVTPFFYKASCIALTAGEILTIPRQDFNLAIRENAILGEKLMKEINKVVEKRLLFIEMTTNK